VDTPKPRKPNDKIRVDESDNVAPGISPTNPSSMSRAEDDEIARERSPEYHDGRGRIPPPPPLPRR
jgi:hypothetical protein